MHLIFLSVVCFQLGICSSLSREVGAWTWREELIQRAWRRDAHWLVLYGLLSLLFYTTQNHQHRDGITHNKLDPFPSITSLKMVLHPDLTEAFFLS